MIAPNPATNATADAQRISRDHINSLPIRVYEGAVVLVRDDAALRTIMPRLEAERCLGFDTESRPAFRKGEAYPISLLQLATADCVYLFQLQRLKRTGPLFNILSRNDILKVGVALHDDVRKLRELRDFKPAGFVEISDHTQRHGILNTGLRSLTGHFLQFRISKRAQVTNWARPTLTSAQIQYAATDAWVSRELYLALLRERIIPADRAAVCRLDPPASPATDGRGGDPQAAARAAPRAGRPAAAANTPEDSPPAAGRSRRRRSRRGGRRRGPEKGTGESPGQKALP